MMQRTLDDTLYSHMNITQFFVISCMPGALLPGIRTVTNSTQQSHHMGAWPAQARLIAAYYDAGNDVSVDDKAPSLSVVQQQRQQHSHYSRAEKLYWSTAEQRAL